MSEIFYVVPEEQHNALVAAVYRKRGYTAADVVRLRGSVRERYSAMASASCLSVSSISACGVARQWCECTAGA